MASTIIPAYPVGQHRGLLVVAQRLVAPGRVGVVVAVPLQVVEQHVGRDVVGVPRVRGVDPLVALPLADADLLAQHPVVLHVVDDLEQREADDGLDEQVRHDPEAEPGDQRAPQHHRHQPGVEHVVAEPERVLLLAGVAALLEAATRSAPSRATVRGQNW